MPQTRHMAIQVLLHQVTCTRPTHVVLPCHEDYFNAAAIDLDLPLQEQHVS